MFKLVSCLKSPTILEVTFPSNGRRTVFGKTPELLMEKALSDLHGGTRKDGTQNVLLLLLMAHQSFSSTVHSQQFGPDYTYSLMIAELIWFCSCSHIVLHC